MLNKIHLHMFFLHFACVLSFIWQQNNAQVWCRLWNTMISWRAKAHGKVICFRCVISVKICWAGNLLIKHGSSLNLATCLKRLCMQKLSMINVISLSYLQRINALKRMEMSTYVNILTWILKIIQLENTLTLCIVIIIQSNTEKKSCLLIII